MTMNEKIVTVARIKTALFLLLGFWGKLTFNHEVVGAGNTVNKAGYMDDGFPSRLRHGELDSREHATKHPAFGQRLRRGR